MREVLTRQRRTAGQPPETVSGAPAPHAPPSPPRWRQDQVLDRVRKRIRSRRLSQRTEETYLLWIRRYIDYHGRHPASLGRVDLERFITHLATETGIGPQSQNQAASAVAFLYRELYGQDFGGRNGVVRAKPPRVLPKYATPEEVRAVLAKLDGVPLVAAMIMYGSGTRIAETMSLRIKDLSLATHELHVRGGKGRKDRITVIGRAAVEGLQAQVRHVERLHRVDLDNGGGWAPLPGAMHRKDPGAGWEIGWQYLFPSPKTTIDEKTGRPGRRPTHVTQVQRAVKKAARASGVRRPVTCHVLRHCFATEMIKSGCDIRLLQRLMGHQDLRTTARYLHILDRPGIGLVSPLDRLPSPNTEEG